MKRKYILVAAALVVLCAGAAAYSMNQNTELPSSTPNSSSAPASVASSEPESGSTSVTDNRDIAKAENFVAYQVTKEEDTTVSTGTETHPEDQVNVSQDKVDAEAAKHDEYMIQSYMDYYGMTQEEAEAAYQRDAAEAHKKQEEALQNREEMNAEREAEEQAHSNAIDQWYRENTGMSRVDWLKLSIDEKSEWMYAHPDVDFSTSPEFQ